MKRILVAAVCAALGCACLFGFYGCGTDPEYDVYVNFYCYYDEEFLYDEIPSADKYVCTFRAEKDKDAQGTLKYREKGYYYFTYEVFYSTGIPYEMNSEEKEAQVIRAMPDEIYPERNTKSISKLIRIETSRGGLERFYSVEIQFGW